VRLGNAGLRPAGVRRLSAGVCVRFQPASEFAGRRPAYRPGGAWRSFALVDRALIDETRVRRVEHAGTLSREAPIVPARLPDASV